MDGGGAGWGRNVFNIAANLSLDILTKHILIK